MKQCDMCMLIQYAVAPGLIFNSAELLVLVLVQHVGRTVSYLFQCRQDHCLQAHMLSLRMSHQIRPVSDAHSHSVTLIHTHAGQHN